jgi:hypothetical protein
MTFGNEKGKLWDYDEVSLIFGTGADIFTAVAVAHILRNSRK